VGVAGKMEPGVARDRHTECRAVSFQFRVPTISFSPASITTEMREFRQDYSLFRANLVSSFEVLCENGAAANVTWIEP
jgi:hypothetical protein